MKLLIPGPPKLPKTFPAPCAKKIAAKANLIGIVTQDEDVEIILLNMSEILSRAGPLNGVGDISRGTAEQGNREKGEEGKSEGGTSKVLLCPFPYSPFTLFPCSD